MRHNIAANDVRVKKKDVREDVGYGFRAMIWKACQYFGFPLAR